MSEAVAWDSSKIEPVVITHNRAQHLERTLRAFLDAGRGSLRMHVLDNASTDRTAQVVEDFQREWPGLLYHRNKYNIGGNANILRAVEISDSEYCWIVGDDDEWHLHEAHLLSAVLEKKPDIVRLGWLASEDSRGKLMRGNALALEERFFFASVSMISATIIRRSIVSSRLPLAYMNTGDAYPQLVSIMRALQESEISVYTLPRNVMTHTPNAAPGYYFGDLEWYAAWFRSGRFIDDLRLRSKFIGEAKQYANRNAARPSGEFGWYTKVALNYKALGIDQWPHLLSMLAHADGRRFMVVGVMLVYRLVPDALARLLRTLYRKSRHIPERELKFDRSRL